MIVDSVPVFPQNTAFCQAEIRMNSLQIEFRQEAAAVEAEEEVLPEPNQAMHRKEGNPELSIIYLKP